MASRGVACEVQKGCIVPQLFGARTEKKHSNLLHFMEFMFGMVRALIATVGGSSSEARK